MGLKSILKNILAQDDKPGTAVGRLLEKAMIDPFSKAAVSAGDKVLEGGLKAVLDDDASTDIKEIAQDTLKYAEEDLYFFAVELLHDALEAHNMPFVEGNLEVMADTSVENFVKSFIEQRKQKALK
jgi:hypothetical protein